MKHQYKLKNLAAFLILAAFTTATQAAILVDLSPGTGVPPATLGGYGMVGFPTDPTAEGTLVTSLTPPASAPVTGDLTFTSPVEHYKAGSVWDTWSHGYSGDVYSTLDSDLLMLLPVDTMAFYLYVQPNLKFDFEFKVDSSATTVLTTINGDGGARYVGFYSDDPMDPLLFVYVRQTTMDSDGFAVGEFGINGMVIPEPSTWVAGVLVVGLLGGVSLRGRKH